jgi:hypothetical protein
MATLRKAFSLFVGGIQCVLGGIASVLAYLVFTSRQAQETLSIASREVPLFMFLLLAFGMFSILSGLFLVREGNGGY